MGRLIYLDQNAWVALSKGAWDKSEFPREHVVLAKIVEGVTSKSVVVPLTYTNIYETAKINDPVRRENMARTQALISTGRVFRSRRRIFEETLTTYIADRFSIARPKLSEQWFLSELWFEAATDYSPELYGLEIPDQFLDMIRKDPARALFDYLTLSNDITRRKAVQHYSANSVELITRMEARRSITVGKSMALRRRAYGANLVIDEIDFIIEIGKNLGLDWQDVHDIGSSLIRSLTVDVPILNIEREIAIRREDQSKAIEENDLRDMIALMTVLPFADIVVAENSFVNLARQARLGKTYNTKLLTSIFEIWL